MPVFSYYPAIAYVFINFVFFAFFEPRVFEDNLSTLSGKVYVHSTLPRPHLCDYTGNVVVHTL